MKKFGIFSLIVTVCISYSFSHRPLKWVAIGDSITYLNDHQNETGNRVTKGYMTRVTEKLPYISVTNQGHNGWTAARIANEIENLGLEKADIYTIFLGTNDWWQGRPVGSLNDYTNNTGISTLYGSFRVILNKLKSLNAEAKIILITPMQRADFVYINNPKNNAFGSYKQKNGQWLSQFAGAIDSIAAYEHINVVDLYSKSGMTLKNLVRFKHLKDTVTGAYKNYSYPKFIGIPFNPEKDEYPYPAESINMTYDGLHPSDKGYAVISKMLVKIMKKFN
jgi:lysophospholipase L1-like esterase